MEKQGKQWQISFLGSKITADSGCSLKKKSTCSFGEKKTMKNVNSILKRRDILLPVNLCLLKVMAFSRSCGGYENGTKKKAEYQRTDAFELWCWTRLLRVPWSARKSNQSILKGNQSWISFGRTNAETKPPILWPLVGKNWIFRKDPDDGKD